MTIAKPHCTPFSLLLKDQILLPFLCRGWKDGRGVKWRLNAFNPIRQNPLSTDADEDSIFPSSHSPWRAQQKLCRVGLWAALLLPLKKCMPRAPELRLSHDDLTCPSPLSLLVESIVPSSHKTAASLSCQMGLMTQTQLLWLLLTALTLRPEIFPGLPHIVVPGLFISQNCCWTTTCILLSVC